MKPTALLSSLALMVLLLAVIFFNQSDNPTPGETNLAKNNHKDSAANQNSDDADRPLSRLSLDRLMPKNREINKNPVRSRPRQLLDAAGKVVFYAQPEKTETKKSSFETVLGQMRSREVQKGYVPADFADVVVSSESVSKHNGLTHIYLRQRIGGVEVYNGDANASIAKDGTVLALHNRFVKDLSNEINLTEPVITAEKAIRLAAQELGVRAGNGKLEITQKTKGPASEAIYEGSAFSSDAIPTKLMYLPQKKQETRLVWNLVLHLPIGSRWMDVNVDAETGQVLSQANWYAHADYRVYPSPFETPLDGARQVVTDPHDTTASPFGWHDTNGVTGAEFTDTRGNNVNAQDDIDANNTGGSRPDGGATLSFDNPIDLGQAPDTYRDGAITNLFYWNNVLHDMFYYYGFDEASGNFQENNYGNGGFGSDPVEADAQDGSGTNNANFGTPPDGSNPRMQMFVWTGPNPDRDSDLDNVIIIHEYGHGVSNRLTGGAANSSALSASQSRGMGEGWSDWWGLVLTAKAGQPSTLNRSVGYYVLGQPTTGGGIRPRPYTTDMAVNEYTYGDLPSGLSVPHGIGFVWCTILWEMYWNLVDQHGFDDDFYRGSGGNNIALQLVMDGLKLQPATPTYLEARDAILLADEVNYGGANRDLIWAAFAKRGMGFSASDSGDPNDLNVTEAFDLPDEEFSINDVTVTETDSGTVNATFTVTLEPAAVEFTEVDYTTVDETATSPADFTPVSGTLSFSIGQSSKSIVVPVVGENLAENDETFKVVLSNAVNGKIKDGEGIGTIRTDDYIVPEITSELIVNGFQESTLIYQIIAANSARSFAIGGSLPPGMTVDSTTGVINWTPSELGTYQIEISAINPAGTDTETLTIVVSDDPLKQGFDLDIPVTHSGKRWFYQTTVTQDGVDAVQSAALNDNEISYFQVAVPGPDTMRFWWKVSSESGYDFLRVYDNGVLVSELSGEQDWQPGVIEITTGGNHNIRFSYEKDASVASGDDAGWVDLISLDSADPRPVIISNSIITGQFGEAFSHQIETTHAASTFSIEGKLQGGLSLDTATGLISGVPTEVGTSQVTITATNASGSAEQLLSIEIQDPVGMRTALDTGLTVISGPTPWFNQSIITHDGIDAAQSGDIDDGESTWFEATVTGPDTLSFYWKVSSESGLDFLRLLDNGVEVTSVSGEQDWRLVTYDIPDGDHTLRWTYDKDPVISVGDDTAWVDQIILASTAELSEALDNPAAFPFTGSPAWYSQTSVTHDGIDATRSGDVGDNQTSWMEINSQGPDTVEFWWKVSSESGYDFLRFLVNGVEISSISGDIDWQKFSHTFGPGQHLLRWEYQKDGSVSTGTDAGWVDELTFLSFDPRPVINSDTSVRGFVGQPFAYQITTSQPADSYQLKHVQFTNFTIDLEAPGTMPYTEDDFTLQVPTPNGGVYERQASGAVSSAPDNGSTYIKVARKSGEYLEISDSTRPTFNAIGIDLAEFTTTFNNPRPIIWTGSKPDGSTVTHTFTTDGVIDGVGGNADFQTFTFPASFLGISRLETDTTLFNFDNIKLGRRDDLTELPAGLTFNASTGLISGTPLAAAEGVSYLEITTTNAQGSFTQTVTITIVDSGPLAESVETSFALGTSESGWYPQSTTHYDGVDAAQSANIGHSETSSFEMTLDGPDTIEFWWKVSSETDFDFLQFLDNDVVINSISGEVDWQKVTHVIPAGTHTLRWQYTKDGSASAGLDAAWVDQISFHTDTPQTINFPAIPDQSESSTYTLSATGGASGNPVIFAVTSGPATITNGNQLSFSDIGAVTVTASQMGTEVYRPATEVAQTFNVVSPLFYYNVAAANAGLTGNDALPDAMPHGNGITNLEKYAFNMDMASSISFHMTDGGTSGLPLLTMIEDQGQKYWSLQYVRMKNIGPLYTPKKADALDGSFTPVTTVHAITSIDETWERIEIREPATENLLFLTVDVTFP